MTTNGKVAVLVTQNGTTGQDVIDSPGKVVLWQSAGAAFGAEADAANNRLSTKVPGYYSVHCQISFEGEVGDIYTIHIYKNGVATAYSAMTTCDTGGAEYNLVVFGGVWLDADDYLELYVESDDGSGSDFVLVHGQFGILSI